MNLRNGKTLRSDNLFKFPDLSLAFLFFSLKFPDYFSPSSISLTFPDFQDSGHSALVINPPVFAFFYPSGKFNPSLYREGGGRICPQTVVLLQFKNGWRSIAETL